MPKAHNRGAVGFTEGIKVHDVISKQLDVQKAKGRTHLDIAKELGYEKPNVISMMKLGTMKVPLDKVPAMAKSLDLEPAFLMRLAMNQYWPGYADAIAQVFGTLMTPNETKILEVIRKASKNTDPALTRDTESKLRAIFKA